MTVDSGKLQRVILNLARNAADAMPGGGTFEIRVEQDTDTDEVILIFADSGTGIPKEVHGTLFDEFVTRGKNHGTGLGLAIVKKIVDLHGGTISFESAPNKGTTFTIRLPRVPASDSASETE